VKQDRQSRLSGHEENNSRGQFMNRLRILVLAPEANPEGICGPLLSFSQAEALAQLHDVTLVIRSPREEPVRRRQKPFRSVEVVRLPRLERIHAWSMRRVFKNNYTSRVLTIFTYPFSVAFEWQAWRQIRSRIRADEFDVVLRLLPIPAVLPSPFAFFLRNGPIPFVIGPVSGGLPWPPGFSQAKKQKEWIVGLRNFYRFLPFARSTYRHAAAIIAGASQTYTEFASYREKLFFLLENGVSRSLCSDVPRISEPSRKLELIFVGGLVPIKGCDLALRAAAPLLRNGLARFTVVGDGPERSRLEALTRSLGIDRAVSFCGWLSHNEAQRRLRQADVLVFPSVRDNSPAVVFEALAAGAVPVVADFGGPGDVVRPEIGYKVPLTNENDVVAQIEKILAGLAQDRDLLNRLRQQGMSYARESLTWDAKARNTTQILHWAVRRGPKPNLPPPKMLHTEPRTEPERVARSVRRRAPVPGSGENLKLSRSHPAGTGPDGIQARTPLTEHVDEMHPSSRSSRRTVNRNSP
jgi:glycosyltransferase involved in cell wall biosynthesis